MPAPTPVPTLPGRKPAAGLLWFLLTLAGLCALPSCLKLLQKQKGQLRKLNRQHHILRQELKELHMHDNSQRDLLCILAHDLRSPFATLKNVVWLLEQDLLEPDVTESLLPRVRLQIDGLYNSLENLLLWSSKQTNSRQITAQVVPVAAIAREIAGMYRPAAQLKSVTLTDPAPSSARVLIDPDALRLILRNLLDNAIKFTPSGGTIAIAVQSGPEGVVLRIEDTGMGMNDAQMAQLFNGHPDGSLVRRGTGGEKGLGLGLQLCQSYAEHCGGQLTVSSHPGQGTRFEVCLPSAPKQLNN